MSMASQSPRPGGGNQFGDAESDLPALGAALWRNKWQIVRPTVLAALIAIAVVEMIVPKYLSEARVLIEGRDNVFLRPNADKDLIDRGTVDQEAVTSQVQLILSRDLASEVIDKLKLGERPEFDPAIAGISPLKKVLGIIGVIKNPMRMTPEERVLDAYYDRLQVFPVEKSRVIVIDFLSEDPKLAAEVANTIAEAYLVRQQAAKQQQARAAGEWLAGEIETMRQKVADAEAKVEAFRSNSNLLVGPNNTTLSAQSLGDVNAQLAAARAQKGDAQSKAKLIREMLRSGGPLESSDILSIPSSSVGFPSSGSPCARSSPSSRRHCSAIIRASRSSRRRSPTSTSRSGPRRTCWRIRWKTMPSSPTRASIRFPQASISSRARRLEPTSRTCSCARSSVTPNRSANCSNPISPNTARRPRATPSIRPRPTPA